MLYDRTHLKDGEGALISACHAGNLAEVELLLSKRTHADVCFQYLQLSNICTYFFRYMNFQFAG